MLGRHALTRAMLGSTLDQIEGSTKIPQERKVSDTGFIQGGYSEIRRLTGDILELVPTQFDEGSEANNGENYNAAKSLNNVSREPVQFQRAYELPITKTPTSAIFCDLGKCRRQMRGNGKASMMASMMVFGIDCP